MKYVNSPEAIAEREATGKAALLAWEEAAQQYPKVTADNYLDVSLFTEERIRFHQARLAAEYKEKNA